MTWLISPSVNNIVNSELDKTLDYFYSYTALELELNTQELTRLTSLKSYEILDTALEPEYDDFTKLASQICGTPISAISFIDENRQWFKSSVGLKERQTPREISFCTHTIQQNDLFIVENALEDARFKNNPLVTGDLGIRFYAGAPLRSHDGQNLGTICVIDTKPRQITAEQGEALRILSKQLITQLEYRRLTLRQKQAIDAHGVRDRISQNFPGVLYQIAMRADGSFYFPYMSERCEDIFGVSAKALLQEGFQVLDRIHPDDQARYQKSVEESSAHLTPWKMSFRILSKYGKYIWVEGASQPFRKPDGEIVWDGVLLDVTEVRNYQEEAERLMQTIDAIPHIIAYFTVDGDTAYVNQAGRKAFGLPPSGPINESTRGIEQVKLRLPISAQKTIFSEALPYAFENGLWEGETVIFDHSHNREERTMFLTLLTHKDRAGELLYVSIVMRDLTEQKNAYSQLEKQRSLMIETSKMASLGEMASGIAHEINNPLAIILGKTALLKELVGRNNSDAATIIKHLERIESTSLRISKIIKGLRTFSRNAEKDPLTASVLSLIFEDTFELCKERFRTSSVELIVEQPNDLKIYCRPVQLVQVFLNLLNNAYDAIQNCPDRWVKVHTLVENDRVRINFIDCGPGIPEDIAPKIMNPFFTTKDVGKGTGLGLSIARGIIEDHHGKLWLDRTHPNTCFAIELPLRPTNGS